MAKKARRKSKRPRSPSPRPGRGAGPITLKQAQELVRAQRAERAERSARAGKKPAASRSAEASLAPATPATVGAARRDLQRDRKRELRRRTQEYKATLALMKKRGVKGLGPEREKSVAARAEAANAPLQVFAEGDSWFDYPVPFFGGGVIPRLERELGVPILNLAKAGDEVRYMLGVEERELLIEQFTQGCPAGGDWDAMLFSGGGNDIVGNPMALWIRDYDASLPPEDQIHQPRFDAALALVRAGYEDLIGLRDELSPGTHLVFHGYDFPIPDGRGVCTMGPWLRPTFDLRGFPRRSQMYKATRAMLEQFAGMLHELAAAHPDVTVIGTQGTLTRSTRSWHNELHPSKSGFNKFAKLFRKNLKSLFPTRVP